MGMKVCGISCITNLALGMSKTKAGSQRSAGDSRSCFQTVQTTGHRSDQNNLRIITAEQFHGVFISWDCSVFCASTCS